MLLDSAIQTLFEEASRLMITNGVATIRTRIDTARSKRDADARAQELEEIISQLIDDRTTMWQLNQMFWEDLQAKRLEKEDLEFAVNTLIPLIEDIASIDDPDTVDKIKSLLTLDMLNLLQVIGFNYREALGEPLTKLVRSHIERAIPQDEPI